MPRPLLAGPTSHGTPLRLHDSPPSTPGYGSNNPDGVFAPDNWAISYLRVGYPPSAHASAAAGRAFALAVGDASYFVALLRHHAGFTAADAAAAAAELEDAGAAVRHILARGGPVERDAAAEWHRAWDRLEKRTPRSRRAAVARVRAALGA